MASPTTSTATDIAATAATLQDYMSKLLLLGGLPPSARDLLTDLSVDLAKLCTAVVALAGAPSGPQVTALNALKTKAQECAKDHAGIRFLP